MKHKWTLNIRLFIVTLFISIPVVVLLLKINGDNLENLRNQKLEQDQIEVKSEVSQMDTILELLDISIANLNVSNPDFRIVAQSTSKNLDFWRANQRSMKKIQNLSKASTLEYTIFAYYPNMDFFINDQVNVAISTKLRSILSDEQGNYMKNQWNTMKIEQVAYAVRVFEFDDFYIGAWVSYDELMKKLGVVSNDEVEYHFVDHEGIILNGSGDKTILPDQHGKVIQEHQYWYVSKESSDIADFNFLKMISEKGISNELPKITTSILMFTSVIILVLTTFILGIYRWVIAPMNHMKKSMAIIEAGDMSYRIPSRQGDSPEFESTIHQFNAMMDQLENLKIMIYEGRLERQEIELQYLSQQIQPHFILNSLNTLYNYCDWDPKATKEMIILLTKFYRYVVNVNSKYVIMGQELEHIENYLKLQKVRLSDAFEYDIWCEPALEIVPIPPFIIEGFVINSVKYGISGKKSGWIAVKVESLNEFVIQISIADKGDGFSEDILDSIREYMDFDRVSDELGVGIKNSIERLKIIYKDQAKIRFYNQQPYGAVVEIEIALQKSKEIGYAD